MVWPEGANHKVPKTVTSVFLLEGPVGGADIMIDVCCDLSLGDSAIQLIDNIQKVSVCFFCFRFVLLMAFIS